MSQAKRVAKNTGILYVQMAVTVLMSLYTTRLVLEALGATDFGLFNVVGGAIAMLTFLNIAMASASQRFMSFAQGQGDIKKQTTIFNVSFSIHFIVALFLVLLFIAFSGVLFDNILNIPLEKVNIAKTIYYFLIVSTFFTIIAVPYDAVINAHENMLLVALLRILEVILKFSIAIGLTRITSNQLFYYALGMALIPILLYCIRVLFCHKKYTEVHLKLKTYFDKNTFKEMSSFAGWSLLGSISSILTMQGMTILLNSFFGVIVNAAQAIALQITGQLMAFSTTMLKALNPAIVKSEGENNRSKMLAASITGSKFSFYLMAFFGIPVLFEMPFVLKLWLKNVPEFAIVFCRLNIARSILNQMTITLPTAIGATGNIKSMQKTESIIWIMLLPITYLCFKLGFSPRTIYINLIFMVVLLSFSRIYYAVKICELPIKKFLFEVFVKGFIMLLVVCFVIIIPFNFMEEGFLRLVVIVSVSSISIILMTYYYGLDKKEKEMLNSIKSNLLKIKGKLPFFNV